MINILSYKNEGYERRSPTSIAMIQKCRYPKYHAAYQGKKNSKTSINHIFATVLSAEMERINFNFQ